MIKFQPHLILAACFSALSLSAQNKEIRGIDQSFVLKYISENHHELGLKSGDIADARISDLYRDKSTGVTHAYVQQQIAGLPVINAMAGLHFSSSGKLLHFTNNMSESAGITDVTLPQISEAIVAVRDLTGLNIIGTPTLVNPAMKNRYSDTGLYFYPCWYSEPGMAPVKVYNIITYDLKTGDWWNLFVGADLKLVSRINWTSTCHTGGGENEHQPARRSGNGAEYHAFNFPVESPLYGGRSVLTSPADSVSSPFGWHDIDGLPGADFTITRGNNVYASEDQNADNIPGKSPDGTTSLVFNHVWNPAELNPLNYTDFAITNLFVANNLLHDLSFRYGFDEVSGNFQEYNYTGNGLAGDGVNADAQDGSGTNNANFATPPDGSNPRMQMYIWETTSGGGGYTLKVNSPSNEKYTVGRAQFGGTLSATPITANLVLVNDGSSSPEKGCNTIRNTTAVKGKIAAVERGNCTFAQKAYNAQMAGAIAVVILDTAVQDQVITMSGSDSRVTIPAVFVKFSDANGLMEVLSSGTTNISLYDSTGFMPRTDSDLDMMVIAHEYTHGISNRLTCGPSNTNALNNAEQMGEGWSDFLGLAFTARKGDIGSTPRGVGNWLLGESESGGGIRQYPYSTNMVRNPLTYKSMMDAAAVGRAGVHFVGEIWCSMIWDLYWKMVEKYGFDSDLYKGSAGNNMAIRLVFEGMKLQKCNPGFVDGRNAILKADSILYGGDNAKMIWEVFARRGLGYSANQGLSTSTRDGVQAFDLPPVFSGSAGSRHVIAEIVSVWPNPTAGMLVLEPANAGKITNVKFTDMSGREVFPQALSAEPGTDRYNLAGLSAGTYQVMGETEKGRWTARVMVVH